jgi:phosphatidylglycerophosphate synthase
VRSNDTLGHAALTTALAALVGVLGLALVVRAALPLGEWYPVKALCLLSIIVLLALSQLRQYHPFETFGVANQLTTARAVLVALVTGLIGEPRFPSVAGTAAAVGVGAAVLDGVDGWLARRTGMSSRFGARFDVEIDALLIQALAILAWLYGKAGPWVLTSGLMRYGFVAAGWWWPWMRRPLAPTSRGKVVCVVQTAALLLTIAPAVEPPLSTAIAASGLLALSYSFLVDILRLRRGSTC